MYARQKILFTFTINIENMVKTHHIRFYLIKLLITTFSIIFAAWILQKGIHIEDPKLATGIIVAITLILVNMFIRPLLIMLTIPLSIASFGIFIIFINAFVIQLVDFLIPKFSVDNFGWTLLFSMIVSLCTTLLEGLGNTKIIKISKDDDFTDYEEV